MFAIESKARNLGIGTALAAAIFLLFACSGGGGISATTGPGHQNLGQSNARLTMSGYTVALLTSDVPGAATHTDGHIKNAWGLAAFPGGPFWVSDNDTGFSTIYDNTGELQAPVVKIPAAPELPKGSTGLPTGIVANPSAGFVVRSGGLSGTAFFIFDSLDGTISGWNPTVDNDNAVIAVDNNRSHAVYTGLAIAQPGGEALLYAGDAVNNRVDIYDGNFKLVRSFSDPGAPAGLSVYGVQLIGNQLFVTFASPVPSQGGAVEIFDTNGNLVRRFAKNSGAAGPLQGPWGMAKAPANFGAFSNALLVGNVDDGRVSAYDLASGKFLGQLKTKGGQVISFPGLWALQFGNGGPPNGQPNQLFFTAGPQAYRNGLFGMITAN